VVNRNPPRFEACGRARRAPSIPREWRVPWRGGAGEAVVDGFAQAFVRDRGDGDRGCAASVELGEEGEEVRSRFDEVAGRA
jgi:hypothetical protein